MMLDPSKSTLHKNYKLSTADRSQVCDGGSWENLREAATTEDITDKFNYRPSTSRKSHSGSGRAGAAFEEKQQDAPSSFLPRASLADDESTGFLDLSEKTESERSTTSTSRTERRPSGLSSSQTSSKRTKSRRSSDGDFPASKTSNPKNIVLRKLSEPMHRSMSSNSLSGIMRPSRYSSNNLASMDATLGQRPTMGRTASCVNFSREPSLRDKSNAAWVAHGVDISKNMEVYVFKK
jgi:hypothetical protein